METALPKATGDDYMKTIMSVVGQGRPGQQHHGRLHRWVCSPAGAAAASAGKASAPAALKRAAAASWTARRCAPAPAHMRKQGLHLHIDVRVSERPCICRISAAILQTEAVTTF